jgi:hypothetical protein
MTEEYQSSVSINQQTLIGQVGGILGITLGWSGMTLFEEVVMAISYIIDS